MSLTPMLWAMKAAPVADTTEKLILISLAERADEDGCDAFPSKATLAKDALCDEKTVQRKLGKLADRKLIGMGDQRAAQYIEKRYRPKVYDLLIPYSWFPDVDDINETRRRRGRGLLTPENRPDIVPAPTRVQRSDKGKPRAKQGSAASRGDKESPLENQGAAPASGGTESPARGDSQSQQGGLTDPQTSPVEPPHSNLPMAPSARNAGNGRQAPTGSSARGTSSGSAAADGAGAPNRTSARSGREVLVTAEVQRVLEGFPDALREALVRKVRSDRPKTVVQAIEKQLAGGGLAQAKLLGDRVARRWVTHGYTKHHAEGTLTSPVGAAVAMLQPGPCPEPRCEDGELDDGNPCRSCLEREKDRRADKERARKARTAEKEAEFRRRACPYCKEDRGTAGQPCGDCAGAIASSKRDAAAFVDQAVAEHLARTGGDHQAAAAFRAHVTEEIERARMSVAARGADLLGQALTIRLTADNLAREQSRLREQAAAEENVALAAETDRPDPGPVASIPAQPWGGDHCPGHENTGCPWDKPAVGTDGLCARCRIEAVKRQPAHVG
ncbi:helix-turn-helix domain-containing protein (plasmid) [Streptomyces sp. NBC_01241]|uniref:helix-turn-helix domain-containing protein n=1 Tax=Streptomyces sp. NBC_01241 TaxID=2903794 RepID=UPI002F917E3B|nr:helix-turn-helix domain-containing protein [Streptomyces sp. NBC_01241]